MFIPVFGLNDFIVSLFTTIKSKKTALIINSEVFLIETSSVNKLIQ